MTTSIDLDSDPAEPFAVMLSRCCCVRGQDERLGRLFLLLMDCVFKMTLEIRRSLVLFAFHQTGGLGALDSVRTGLLKPQPDPPPLVFLPRHMFRSLFCDERCDRPTMVSLEDNTYRVE